MNFSYQNILVIGLARSGLAAIKVLHKLGVKKITLTEQKTPENLDELKEYGVTFVAQSDEVFEGDYDLVIKNPGISPLKDFVIALRERKIPVITEAELAFLVAKPQHYLAITGTNGKTTTTTLVYEMLKKAYGNLAHVAGNIGKPLCEVVVDENLLEEAGHYIALELSQGQLIDMFDFHPEVSTIINLTPDHIDFMGSLENYYVSKTRIYQNTQKEDYFILNKDDEEVKKYIQKYPLPCSSISFSLENKEADAYIENGYLVKDGKAFLDLAKVTLPGKHNIQNIMIASLMCMCVGVKEEDIQDVVYHFSGVEHRIEFVKEIDGVKYYNDSKATNTDATITALKAFEKGVFLLVGGFEKGLAMDEVKKYLAPVKKVIGYGASGKRIAHDLVGEDAIVVNDLQEAILCAKELAMKGDVVLLSPTTSSFDQYTSFEERGKHFKRIVESL